MKVAVSFGARALVGANDGVEPSEAAARYASLLRDALAREWPSAMIDVSFSDDRAPTRVEVGGEAEERAREIERNALDLAWVIKQMGAWAA